MFQELLWFCMCSKSRLFRIFFMLLYVVFTSPQFTWGLEYHVHVHCEQKLIMIRSRPIFKLWIQHKHCGKKCETKWEFCATLIFIVIFRFMHCLMTFLFHPFHPFRVSIWWSQLICAKTTGRNGNVKCPPNHRCVLTLLQMTTTKLFNWPPQLMLIYCK